MVRDCGLGFDGQAAEDVMEPVEEGSRVGVFFQDRIQIEVDVSDQYRTLTRNEGDTIEWVAQITWRERAREQVKITGLSCHGTSRLQSKI